MQKEGVDELPRGETTSDSEPFVAGIVLRRRWVGRSTIEPLIALYCFPVRFAFEIIDLEMRPTDANKRLRGSACSGCFVAVFHERASISSTTSEL